MTKEEIEKMEAGHALDVRIASWVIYHAPIDNKGWIINANGSRIHIFEVEPYSTEIASAWLVVEHMGKYDGFSLVRQADGCRDSKLWSARCFFEYAEAYTAPLAICKVALLNYATK